MTYEELARDFALKMIEKSGVREWDSPATVTAIANAALDMAALICEDCDMAVTAIFRQQSGTAKTVKSSAGDGTITLASLANGAYRESTKVDFGATRGQSYLVEIDIEIAATPTAGNTLDLWANQSSSATAGTDNRGGASGADQAYTGYSSNAAASAKLLTFIGGGPVTSQATSTVQKTTVGYFSPAKRYCSFVLLNGSGAAIHSSDSNCVITFTPVEFTSEPS